MKLMKIVGDVKEKKILLLQGPMGSYFNTLDTKFTNEGAKVFRIGFNAGDEFFARTDHYTGYKDKPKNWQKFVEEFYKKYDIPVIYEDDNIIIFFFKTNCSNSFIPYFFFNFI